MRRQASGTSQSGQNVFIVIALLLFMISGISSVDALGISPAKKSISFEPGGEGDLEIRVLNPQGDNARVLLYPKGELAQYVSLPQTLITFKDGEKEKRATYHYELPQSFDDPGMHSCDIVAMRLPDGTNASTMVVDGSNVIMQNGDSQTVVSATVAVASAFNVFVPYPGTYAEGKLLIDSADVGEDVGFRIPVYNFGKDEIESISAKIEVRGPTNEVIARVESEDMSIPSKQERQLMASWPAEVNSGMYHAVARVSYGEKRFRLEKNFYVGEMQIEVVRVLVPEFSLGEIAKFSITMRNRWNQKIQDAYARLAVFDSLGSEITTFKTESFGIASDEEKTVNAFWDTEGVQPGKYDVDLDLHYADKVTEERFKAQVNLDSIQTDFTPVAKAVDASGDRERRMVPLLIGIIAILIVLNIFWFVYMSRRKEG